MLAALFLAAICTFTPPSDWQIGQLKKQTPYVQVGFLGKGSTLYQPCINLAIEEDIEGNLKDYVKAVKEIYREDPKANYRDLGKFNTAAGPGRLIEMTATSPFGEVKILQVLTVQDKKAYILTASVLKEDFSKLQAEILKSFRSLSILPDLFAALPYPESQSELQLQFSSLGQEASEEEKKGQWEQFQKSVLAHSEMGSYWQFQILKEARAKIYP